MIRKNTLIKTKEGDKYIQDLTDDDLILSYNIRTGELCYNKPLVRTTIHINGKAALIQENNLFLTKLSCVIDHNLNEELLVDANEVMTDPGVTQLQTVHGDLSSSKGTVTYVECEDDFFSLLVKDTDFYFANDVMISNGTSFLFIKDNYTFLKEDIRYAKSDEYLLDPAVERFFRNLQLDEYVVLNSPLRFASQALLDAKKNDSNHTYYQKYFAKMTLLLANTFVGERTIWR